MATNRDHDSFERRIGLGQAVQETIVTGEAVVGGVIKCAVGPEGQLAVLRLGQELGVGRRCHPGVIREHTLPALGQAECPARLDDKLIRPGHHDALGQGRCFLRVHRPSGAEFVFGVQSIVQNGTGGQAVDPVAEPTRLSRRCLAGVIPLGGVRATVGIAPDKKEFRVGHPVGQAAREGDRLRRPLGRRFANDLRQARLAGVGRDDLGDDQHVGTGQAAVQAVNGEDVFTGAQPFPVCGDVERLVPHRQRVVMQGGGTGIPPRVGWRIGGGHPLAVEVGDETVVVFHPEAELPDRVRVIDIEGIPQVKRFILVVHLRAKVERGTDERLVAAAAFVAGPLTASLPGFVVERRRGPCVVVASMGRHPAARVFTRAKERVTGTVHDELHRTRGPLAQRVLDRVLDHPGASGRTVGLERQQAVRVVTAPAIAHHRRAMHGQAAQFAGPRSRAVKTEAAGEIILSVPPLAGGADGEDRLGLVRATMPGRVVIGQRVEADRLAGAEVHHIRLGDRRLVDVIERKDLALAPGAVPDGLAAAGIRVDAHDVHRRVADHLVHRRLFRRAQLGDAAVAGQFESARLSHGQVQLVGVALGIADHHRHVALVQPAAPGIAPHRVAEPGRASEPARRREHRLSLLNRHRAGVARRDASDLRQRQAVFLPAINFFKVVGQHVEPDSLARCSPGDVVHGERHLVRVAHRRRPTEPSAGPVVNLGSRRVFLPLDVLEKRPLLGRVLPVHDAPERVRRTEHMPQLMAGQRPAETGPQHADPVARVQRALEGDAQDPAAQPVPEPDRRRLPVGRLRAPPLRPVREIVQRAAVVVEWDVIEVVRVGREDQLLHQ